MEIFNIESFIKDLSPELQEKARACTTIEELLKFADDNDIEIPKDALEAASGGSSCGGDCYHVVLDIEKDKHAWDNGREYYWHQYRCRHCSAVLFGVNEYGHFDKKLFITKEQYDRMYNPFTGKYLS
ncbi:hypothetical protein SAMN04487934_103123 [Eubacterium ruminantium]|nr:hypothetical protein SAMN04487934_103123 [Eubacterium ruminantium]